MNSFDVTVIGAGPGGYVAAIRAAQLGKKVALVEKEKELGGTCLRVGCIPSKALLQSSENYWSASKHFKEHGIDLKGIQLNLPTMIQRKDSIVSELTGGIQMLMKKNKVTVFHGHGSLLSNKEVQVTNEKGESESFQTENIILATGSEVFELPHAPFDGKVIISSTEALSLPKVPKHLIVVGAGAVGLELGSVWLRLGAKVTVVELAERITPFADKRMSSILLKSLESQGMEFRLQSKMTAVKTKQNSADVTIQAKEGQEETLSCDVVLVAVGRKPYSANLGLEKVGIALDSRGRVPVNAQLQTQVTNIYAIGDLVEGPMLAHKAEEEGIMVAETLSGFKGHLDHNLIPSVVYTDPELAMVGKTEEQLKEAGIPTKTGRFPFRSNGRAKSYGHVDGEVKIIAHATTDRILGVHIVGSHASELIAEAVIAMEFGASSEDIARTSHAHPTLSEVMKEAAFAVEKRSING